MLSCACNGRRVACCPPTGADSGVLPGRGAGAAAHHTAHPGRLLRHRARSLTRTLRAQSCELRASCTLHGARRHYATIKYYKIIYVTDL